MVGFLEVVFGQPYREIFLDIAKRIMESTEDPLSLNFQMSGAIEELFGEFPSHIPLEGGSLRRAGFDRPFSREFDLIVKALLWVNITAGRYEQTEFKMLPLMMVSWFVWEG